MDTIRPLFLWCLSASLAGAVVTPAPLFRNGAVLQRDKEIRVWGRSPVQAKITVSFAGQSHSCEADASGRWSVTLPPMEASAEGRTMTIQENDSPELEIRDVLVGEVWLASGQSNMELPVEETDVEDRKKAADGPVPLLRLFKVPRALNHLPQETVGGSWVAATPESTRSFSAVGYFFGRKLADDLQVPVGIIASAWGGTRIEPWWNEEGLAGIPELDKIMKARMEGMPGSPAYKNRYRAYAESVGKWSRDAVAAVDADGKIPPMPKQPSALELRQQTGIYQAMIHPLAPYSLRGFLWYQGESNVGDGPVYAAKMRALVRGWRQAFRNPEAPFLFTQIAPYNYPKFRKNCTTDTLPGFWLSQQDALSIPHTGMAITIDVGDPDDIHPRKKSTVGQRLALWALADTYGARDLVKSGPMFSGYSITDKGIVVKFDHVGGGLASRDGKPLTGFEVADKDGEFRNATAVISEDGKSVLLANSGLQTPERARFGWSATVTPNLMNREGLPAAAFTTHRH